MINKVILTVVCILIAFSLLLFFSFNKSYGETTLQIGLPGQVQQDTPPSPKSYDRQQDKLNFFNGVISGVFSPFQLAYGILIKDLGFPGVWKELWTNRNDSYREGFILGVLLLLFGLPLYHHFKQKLLGTPPRRGAQAQVSLDTAPKQKELQNIQEEATTGSEPTGTGLIEKSENHTADLFVFTSCGHEIGRNALAGLLFCPGCGNRFEF